MNKKTLTYVLLLGLLASPLSACKSHPDRVFVTFKNYDGSFLYATDVEYGGTVSYEGNYPTKPYSMVEHYEFVGWDNSLENITADTVYIAQYQPVEHSFVDIKISPTLTENGYTYHECACGYSYRDNFVEIVPIVLNVGDEIIDVISNTEYKKIMNATNDGWRSDIYNHLLNALFTYELENENSYANQTDNSLKNIDISDNVRNKMQAFEQEVRDFATNNEITYEEALSTMLMMRGCSNIEELNLQLSVSELKDVLLDWYVEHNFDSLLERYIDDYQPYHVKHILRKSFGSMYDEYGKYTNGTISVDEANSFYGAAKSFMDGATFGSVYSDDNGSSQHGGDVGIMNTHTSFIAPFKFSVYAFDGVYSGTVTEQEATQANIGLWFDYDAPKTVYDNLKEIGLKYVPFGALEKLHDVAELPSLDDEYRSDLYLPRNIYFNKYINRQNVFVITNNGFSDTSTVRLDKAGDDVTPSDVDTSLPNAQEGKTGFRYIPNVCKDENQKILTDEQGRPIFCVYGPYGLHFIVIEESPFEDDVKDYYRIKNVFEGGRSYVNFETSDDQSYYAERIQQIKNDIKNLTDTPHFEYTVFQYFLNHEPNLSFKFADESIDFMDEIAKAISQDYYNYSYDFAGEWKEYLKFINIQEERRKGDLLIAEPIE